MAQKHVDLQEQLSQDMRLGHKASLRLHGLIRKLHSLKALVQMKKEDAKKEIDEYVNKLSESLLEFRAEMLMQVEAVQREKFREISELEEGYEMDINTFNRLFEEAQRYVQFDKRLRTDSDRQNSQKLINALRQLLADQADGNEMTDILHLEFKPAIPVPCIGEFSFGNIEKSPDQNGKSADEETANSAKNPDTVHTAEDNKENVMEEIKRLEVKNKERIVEEMKKLEVEKKLRFMEEMKKLEVQYQEVETQTEIPYPAVLPSGNCVGNVRPDMSFQQQYPMYSQTPAGFYRYVAPMYTSPPGFAGNNPLVRGSQMHLSPMQSQPCVNSASSNTDGIKQSGRQIIVSDIKTEANHQSANSSTPKDVEKSASKDTFKTCIKVKSDSTVDAVVKAKNEEKDCFIVGTNLVGKPRHTDSDCFIVEKFADGDVIDLTEHHKNDSLEISRDSAHSMDSGIMSPPGIEKDMKENYVDRQLIILPLKPLRKPLRLPKMVSEKLDCKKTTISHTEHDKLDLCEQEHGRNVIEGTGDGCQKAGNHINNASLRDGQKTPAVDVKHQVESHKVKDKPLFRISPLKSESDLTDHIKTNGAGSVTNKIQLMEEKLKLESKSDGSIEVKKEQLGNTAKHAVETSVPPGTVSTSTGASLKAEKPDEILKTGDRNNNSCSQMSDKELFEKILSQQGRKTKGENEPPVKIKLEDCVKTEINVTPSETIPAEDKKRTDVVSKVATYKPLTSESATAGETTMTPVTAAKKAKLQKQTKQLANCVRDFLGGNPDSRHPPQPSYIRLGAVQSHWLTNPGKDLNGAFLFQLRNDLQFPIGVTTDKQGNIIVTNTGNNLVKMFDSAGNDVKVIGEDVVTPLKRPSAVVVNNQNEIFVKDDACIHKFDSQGKFMLSIGKRTLFRPFGLDMTPAGNLITLMTNPHLPSLVHLSQNGEQVWTFVYTPLVNAHYASKCRFLAVSDNSVIVSDLGLSKIYLTSLEGIFLGEFGSYGTGPDNFMEPSGISVDSYGNALIGDSKNNRIKMYRQNGAFIGMVRLDAPIVRPSGVHFTKDNRLIIVNYLQHSVKVYKLGSA